MKKLVTAKEQFENRLKSLNVFDTQTIDKGLHLYSGQDENNQFCILRNEGGILSECRYGDEYEAIVTSENFLVTMVERFKEGKREIKPLFDWYASADHYIDSSSPLDLQDIFNMGIEKEYIEFEDVYEDEYRCVYTAQEQWEDASKNAREIPSHEGCTCKFEETEKGIAFYIYDYESFESYHFPTFDELRKDGDFVSSYIDIVNKLHPEDLPLAIKWLNGGDYNMSDVTLLDIKEALEDREDYGHIFYTDKELTQEQSIEEMIALTPEQQERVKEFEVALNTLKDSGVKIISYWDENEFFAVNGNCNVELDCSYYLSKKDYENSEDISVLLQKKHRFPFSWDLYWGVDTSFCAKKL